jgi:catechol 2,3-dioxygenase-like lactoylglutathione lyase family enzyme
MIVQPIISVRSVEDSVAFYRDVAGFPHAGDDVKDPEGKAAFGGVMVGEVMLMFNRAENEGIPADAPRGIGVELHVGLDESVSFAQKTRDVTHAEMEAAMRGPQDKA